MCADLRIGSGTGPDPVAMHRPPPIRFGFDGQTHRAHPGETIAAALLASGVRALRATREAEAPRGLFCGIGACFECLVCVNGGAPRRACVTPVRDGDEIESFHG